MNIADIITIIVAIVFALLGFVRGFGKSLKSFTGGIIGIIISIFVCAALGGMIMGIPAISERIGGADEYFAGISVIFAKIPMGTVIFYIAMFIVCQILRILVVKLVCRLFEAENKAMKTVNKTLGLVFAPAAAFMFLLLFLAVLKLFDSTEFVRGLAAKAEGSYLLRLYEVNPIVLAPKA